MLKNYYTFSDGSNRVLKQARALGDCTDHIAMKLVPVLLFGVAHFAAVKSESISSYMYKINGRKLTCLNFRF